MVRDLVDLHDSAVTTSVAGGTDPTAGNILIDPKALVIDNSQIQANAPAGFGGTVTIVADNIVVPGGDFEALLERGDISATGGEGVVEPASQDWLRKSMCYHTIEYFLSPEAMRGPGRVHGEEYFRSRGS